MRSFAIWVVLMASAACGKVGNSPDPDAQEPTPEDTGGVKSGARLKARWHDFDGTKVLAGLLDSTRNELCAARKFTDAKTYCVPPAGSLVYRDAGCTMPLGYQPRSCPAVELSYFIETDPTACDNASARKVYPRGAQVALASYYTMTNGVCSGPIDSSNSDLFALAAEVPLTDFVTLEAEEAPPVGRIQQRFSVGSDGSRIPRSLYDNELASDCTMVLEAGRTTARCLPTSTQLGTFFGDATCTSQRTAFRKGCTAPKHSARYERFCTGVAAIPSVFRNGALTTAPLFVQSGMVGQCTTTTAAATSSYYEVGAAVELESVSRAQIDGTGRYRRILTTSGTNSMRDGLLYDTVAQTECSVVTQQDGSVRCLPLNVYGVSSYYSDAACTVEQPVIIVPDQPATGCTLPALPGYTVALSLVTEPTCALTRNVRKVGELYTGTLYTKVGAASCLALTLGVSKAYAVGAVGAIEDWPAATVVTDP